MVIERAAFVQSNLSHYVDTLDGGIDGAGTCRS